MYEVDIERIGKEAGNDGNEGIGVGLTEEGLLSDGRFNYNEGYEAGGSYDGVNAIETDDLVGSAYDGSLGEEEDLGVETRYQFCGNEPARYYYYEDEEETFGCSDVVIYGNCFYYYNQDDDDDEEEDELEYSGNQLLFECDECEGEGLGGKTGKM
ncbi:MAG: hypothetical protein EZS28_003939 [Streblomastix strix]|uniref:Uncharacterized protein n=1 Tax=Streblomastix strix TaxID=222440 RepID=A0A5J4X1D1_9EUKA|nr:MAG: hypothetical protein EZS28_003939 [Streblomastix strix]